MGKREEGKGQEGSHQQEYRIAGVGQLGGDWGSRRGPGATPAALLAMQPSLPQQDTVPQSCRRGGTRAPPGLPPAQSSAENRILREVAMPRSCSFPHILHFSQPTQSMMDVMFWKLLCAGGRGKGRGWRRGCEHVILGQRASGHCRSREENRPSRRRLEPIIQCEKGAPPPQPRPRPPAPAHPPTRPRSPRPPAHLQLQLELRAVGALPEAALVKGHGAGGRQVAVVHQPLHQRLGGGVLLGQPRVVVDRLQDGARLEGRPQYKEVREVQVLHPGRRYRRGAEGRRG